MRNLFFALVFANFVFAAVTLWHGDPPRASAAALDRGVPIQLVSEVDPRSVDTLSAGEPSADARSDELGSAVQQPVEQPSVLPRPVAPPRDSDAASSALAALEPSLAAPRIDVRVDRPDPAAGGSAAGNAGPDPTRDGAAGTEGAPTAVALAAGADSVCVSIGPFSDAADAETASESIAAEGYPTAPRAADGEIWIGFWVHIDSIPTRAEANAMLTELRENGVAEAYLIPGQEDGDIISLGVFNTMQRAGRLDEQVRALGFEPLIVERSRAATVHWVDVAVPRDGALDLDALDVPRRGGQLEQQACAVP